MRFLIHCSNKFKSICIIINKKSYIEILLYKNFSCYDYSTWTYQGFEVKTDLPSNTFCRAPGISN